ncbi:sorbitol dehydrogenase family protein [Glaciimonas sp. PCH181]|uniref:sorbitol dehydrogenase family protein n=1 Tax=Glaciimonas sp. PCH181 TaxID=2133943 RepID=UPI000D3A364B|nr:sorbitol dehydrogenase family protein [Glaciimonas sp. PCH181]PUA17927.1 hypothetical protein C7W93_18935 [Glaciimonas sp. PCH181]
MTQRPHPVRDPRLYLNGSQDSSDNQDQPQDQPSQPNLPDRTNATPQAISSAVFAPSASPHLLKRRNLLLLAGASFAVLSMPRWLQQASAQSTTVITPKIPAADSQQQRDFLALSVLLTARPKLNSRTSARTYAALSAQLVEFEKQSADLWQFAQTQQIKDVDALVAAVESNADLSKVLHQIVSAWYLGVVGNGAQGQVIAFEQALMFDPVRDAVVVPTYCRAAPGYWVKQVIPVNQVGQTAVSKVGA